ncbi:MAG TPA: LuxR family transcriptional regulator [Spirochaetota bacterium]|mgnify:CR=1 FL=1|nr:LuxR family transcriptional regulator [Spirochaetota bacterium]
MNLNDFIHCTNRAQSFEEVVFLFEKFISQYGFTNYVMGDMSLDSPVQRAESFGTLTNYSPEWLEHYKNNNYVAVDPVIKKALISHVPFTWEEAKCEDKTQDSLNMMNEAIEFNLVNGIGLSVHRPFGRIIGFGLATSEKNPHMDKDTMAILHSVCVHFCNVYENLIGINISEYPVCLTVREKEVLYWISRGSTKKNIAEHFKVSESCVKRHCENILQKLSVKNLAHAVLKGVRSGLISPY